MSEVRYATAWVVVGGSGATRKEAKLVGPTSSLLIKHDASAISLRILTFETSLLSMMRAWKRFVMTVC